MSSSLTIEKDNSLDVISILRSTLSSNPPNPNPTNPTSDPNSNAGYSYFDSSLGATASLSQNQSVYVKFNLHPNLIPLDSVTRLCSSTKDLQSLLNQSGGNKVRLTIPPFLSLRTILFAIEKQHDNLGNYFRECAKEGFPRLEALERNDVLNWLNGKRSDWNGAIDVERIQWDKEATDQAGSTNQTQSKTQTEPTDAKQTTTGPSATTSSVKRSYVPDSGDQNYVKKLRTEKELVIRSHNDVLRGSILNSTSSSSVLPLMSSETNKEILNGMIPTISSGLSDFSSIRKSLYPKLEIMRRSTFNKPTNSKGSSSSSRPTASSLNESSTSNPSSSSNPNLKRNKRPLDPILLLSNSPTSLINIFNVKKFLEEGVFIEPEVARRQAGGISEPVVSVIRTWGSSITSKNNQNQTVGGTKPLRFIVVDNHDMIEKLAANTGGKDEVWNRVCVVFTTGQTWQFKPYKWSEGRELFKHVLGMYVRWNNDDRNPAVRDWNVTELQVERSKRHTDKQLAAHFWRTVESWISRRKPQFVP